MIRNTCCFLTDGWMTITYLLDGMVDDLHFFPLSKIHAWGMRCVALRHYDRYGHDSQMGGVPLSLHCYSPLQYLTDQIGRRFIQARMCGSQILILVWKCWRNGSCAVVATIDNLNATRHT
jgi:hypothetical protein